MRWNGDAVIKSLLITNTLLCFAKTLQTKMQSFCKVISFGSISFMHNFAADLNKHV